MSDAPVTRYAEELPHLLVGSQLADDGCVQAAFAFIEAQSDESARDVGRTGRLAHAQRMQRLARAVGDARRAFRRSTGTRPGDELPPFRLPR